MPGSIPGYPTIFLRVTVTKTKYLYGEVLKWFTRLVLKTSEDEGPPWVRIPPSPPMLMRVSYSGYYVALPRLGGGFDSLYPLQFYGELPEWPNGLVC